MIDIKLVRPAAQIPRFQTQGAAAVDLYACISHNMLIMPNDCVLIPTGIAMTLPQGLCGVIVPRSNLGHHHGIVLGNGTGIIDSDYRGEIFVSIWNRTENISYKIIPQERIAQMLFIRTETVMFNQVDTLSSTDRGAGGFGSTGAV